MEALKCHILWYNNSCVIRVLYESSLYTGVYSNLQEFIFNI